LNVHASRSLDTFADVMAEPAASRVLARSPFGYAHDPDGAAAPWKVVVAGDGALPLLPQAAASDAVVTAMPTPRLERPRCLVVRVLIRTTCRPFPWDRRPVAHTLIKDILLSKTDINMIVMSTPGGSTGADANR